MNAEKLLDFVFILECLYFMLPAYIANMMPVFIKGYKFLAIPVDFNVKLGKNPLFGKSKTWRGIIFAVLAAGFVALLQWFLYPAMPEFGLIDYSRFDIVLGLGMLLGLGAIIGDLVESFFKRRLNIEPGKPWILFDQIDFVIGAVLFSLILFNPGIEAIIIILVISPILHFLTNLVGFYLKIRKSKY